MREDAYYLSLLIDCVTHQTPLSFPLVQDLITGASGVGDIASPQVRSAATSTHRGDGREELIDG